MNSAFQNLVVLYPDLLGKGLERGGFADHLVAEFPEVVALVNGPDPSVLHPPQRDDVSMVISPVAGLAPSLRFGYQASSLLGDVVVRIDTAENPTSRIGELFVAAQCHGAAVGDVHFNAATLRAGSADEHSQLDVFPTMFRRFTAGRLELSGTHGFQAWRSDVLAEVLPLACRFWDSANSIQPMTWGFDAAMVLAADALGITPQVLHFPATELRDRNREKIGDQHDAVLRVLLQYSHYLNP